MKKKTKARNTFILFLPHLLLMLTLFWAAGCGNKAGGTRENGGEGKSPSSEGVEPSRTIMAFGKVVTANRLEIPLPWDCRISEISVWEGEVVSRGETLIVLDSRDFEQALEQARLDVAAAGNRQAEGESRLASLDVRIAEVTARLERLKRMEDTGSISKQELETVQAELDSLVQDRAAASWALAASEAETSRLTKEYQYMEELVSTDHFRENLLVSPFEEAVVAEVSVKSGASVSAGTPVVVLHDLSSLMVEADIPEEFVRDVAVGIGAAVIPVADPKKTYRGTVQELAGLARNVNGETVVKVRIKLEGLDDFLREGFNVDVEIVPEQ